LIDQFAATPSAEHVSAAAFRRRDPTAAFTLHDIAWRGEVQLMTAPTGTANSERFCPPHVVVMMGLTHERVGNFVKNRVQDLFLWGILRKFVRQRNHLCPILTTPSTFPTVIEVKTPQRQLMILQKFARTLGVQAREESYDGRSAQYKLYPIARMKRCAAVAGGVLPRWPSCPRADRQ